MIQADEDGKGQVKAELEKDMLEDRGGKEQGPIIKTQNFFLTKTFLDPTFFLGFKIFSDPQIFSIFYFDGSPKIMLGPKKFGSEKKFGSL